MAVYTFPGIGEISYGFAGVYGSASWPSYHWRIKCEDGEELTGRSQLGSHPVYRVIRNGSVSLKKLKNRQEFHQLYSEAAYGGLEIEYFRTDTERPAYAYYSEYPKGYFPDGTT